MASNKTNLSLTQLKKKSFAIFSGRNGAVFALFMIAGRIKALCEVIEVIVLERAKLFACLTIATFAITTCALHLFENNDVQQDISHIFPVCTLVTRGWIR
jgi:hypothetical protein